MSSLIQSISSFLHNEYLESFKRYYFQFFGLLYPLLALCMLWFTGSSYAFIYLVATFNWSYGFLSIKIACLFVPLSLLFAGIFSTKDVTIGFFAINIIGVATGSIYHYIIKSSTLTKRCTLAILYHIDSKLHNYLFMFLILASLLSAYIPAYFVVFMLKPLVHSLIEVIMLHDKRAYLGTTSVEIFRTLMCFEKAFLVGLAMVTTAANTVSINNNPAGLIYSNMLIMTNHQDISLWYFITTPIFLWIIFSLWIILLTTFLGFPFMLHCLKENIQLFFKMILLKKVVSENQHKQYRNSLHIEKTDFFQIEIDEIALGVNIFFLLLLSITRKPFLYIGWSDLIMEKFAAARTHIYNKEISFTVISSIFVFMFFLSPGKHKIRRINSFTSDSINELSSSYVSNPLIDWNFICKFIPWTCLFCVGASNNLLHGYFLSPFYNHLAPYFAFYNNKNTSFCIKLQLFILGVLLSIFNFNYSVAKILQPLVIFAARSKNESISGYLMYALMGSRASFIGIFSSISNLAVFLTSANLSRRDFLLVGFPLTLVHCFFSLIYLWIFDNSFKEGYQLAITENLQYKPLKDWEYDSEI